MSTLTTRIAGRLITMGKDYNNTPYVAVEDEAGSRDFRTTRFPQGEAVARDEFYRAQVNLMPETAYDGTKCWIRGQIDDDLVICTVARFDTYADYIEDVCSDCGDGIDGHESYICKCEGRIPFCPMRHI